MSRCPPGSLPTLRELASSSSGRPLSAATEAQEMDRSVCPTTQVQDSVCNQARLRKRKKFQAQASTSNTTASLTSKRRRESIEPVSSSPLDVGVFITCHEGASKSHAAGTAEGRRKTRFSSLLSSGLPPFVSPPNASDGDKARITRKEFSGAQEATSAYGSGVGNQSTVTSSNEEEEESTLLHSSGQTSKVASETRTVNPTGSTQVMGVESSGRVTEDHDDHQTRARSKKSPSHTHMDRRKSWTRDLGHDGEVLSPLSRLFTNMTARDKALDSSAGTGLWEVSCGDRSGKTETACVVNSGCSSFQVKRWGRPRPPTDGGSSICRREEDCSEFEQSSCRREVQGSSIGQDFCTSSCSDSILSGLITSYKLYRPPEPSRSKALVATPSEWNSALDEILADERGQSKGKDEDSDATPESSHTVSHAGSSSASEQEYKSAGDDSIQKNAAPTFVLSSGRMSKQEANKLGVRPPTIDGDFDQYFAQLML